MAAKKTKKKTKRSRSKYPGLDPKLNRINLRDAIDYDYIDKLSDKEKDFLNRFSVEYYSADFSGDRTLIKGKKARRKIYKANNDRNQDTTAYLGNFQKLGSYEDLHDDDLKSKSPEDSYIQKLDMTRKKVIRR